MLTSLEEFLTNSTPVHLVESITKYQQLSNQAPHLCQSCAYESQAGVAVASCLHCSIFLCASCVTMHKKLPVTSNHQVVGLDDIKSGKVSSNFILNQKQDLCTVHHDKPMELFCKKEGCFLCMGCAIVKHRDHQYDFIPQIVEEQIQDMELMLPYVDGKIYQLEQVMAEIEKQQHNIGKQS